LRKLTIKRELKERGGGKTMRSRPWKSAKGRKKRGGGEIEDSHNARTEVDLPRLEGGRNRGKEGWGGNVVPLQREGDSRNHGVLV